MVWLSAFLDAVLVFLVLVPFKEFFFSQPDGLGHNGGGGPAPFGVESAELLLKVRIRFRFFFVFLPFVKHTFWQLNIALRVGMMAFLSTGVHPSSAESVVLLSRKKEISWKLCCAFHIQYLMLLIGSKTSVEVGDRVSMCPRNVEPDLDI